ncbi:glycosyltransferase family 4 protein [bacterium]|nr:glycosyltransferase family 4 protein [bacterium]
MKIAHIYYSLGYGGIETLILNLSNSQIRKGYDVSIILVNENFERDIISLLDERIKIIQINRKQKANPMFAVLKLNFTLIKSKFDILHIHAAELARIILPVFNFSKVLHVHSTVGITNSKVGHYRKCIAISEVVRDVLASKYGVKSKVIYNGIDFRRFKKRKLTAVSNKIISVGSLNTEIKNQDGMIRQFALVVNRVSSDLHIVGNGPDYEKLKTLIKELGVSERVFLLGNKSQGWLQENLCGYDLFLQASHNEGLGIAAIEAAASCVPLLLSAADGHIEISNNGERCQLFDPFVDGAMAEGIIEFYKNSDSYFSQAIEHYGSFESKFGFEKYNEQLQSVYLSNY